ncbi:type VI immunity family protein [Myxococcus sp. CA040A]|uniref:type VI immunity family protein n=1 Tax=Myxococcus sp. CA040A TaxID=2741738 RepID=UPI00157A3E33|nr:type VI immunity family protein [Myxococcus sp. CA040A]NTX03418.1 DUF3396 domain-containing protein [Myxococcus sp. CA040A]
MGTNPFIELGPDDVPNHELKQGLVFYLRQAPSPAQARRVHDLYLRHCEGHIRCYRSTALGRDFVPWNREARRHFEQVLLPTLRTQEHWGYVFWDGRARDSWQFMFHGFRPHSEPGRASFYRFEFDWQVSPALVKTLAEEIARAVPFHSGWGGYFLQARKAGPSAPAALDAMYAVARRYWGVNAYNLDVSVRYLLAGYGCVSWLTLIGHGLMEAAPAVLASAKRGNPLFMETDFGVAFCLGDAPVLGDRNRQEPLEAYVTLARALAPLQIQEHASFGGTRWTEECTLQWFRRFTHPDDF